MIENPTGESRPAACFFAEIRHVKVVESNRVITIETKFMTANQQVLCFSCMVCFLGLLIWIASLYIPMEQTILLSFIGISIFTSFVYSTVLYYTEKSIMKFPNPIFEYQLDDGLARIFYETGKIELKSVSLIRVTSHPSPNFRESNQKPIELVSFL